MTDSATPAVGQTDVCNLCGRAITYQGPFWKHVEGSPRHQARPVSLESDPLADADGETAAE